MNFVPKNDSPRRKTLDFTNAVASLHDLTCDCNKPLEHAIDLLVTQEPGLKLNKETSEKIKKCLTTEAIPGAVDAIDGLEDGDLEDLFAEDITEDTG